MLLAPRKFICAVLVVCVALLALAEAAVLPAPEVGKKEPGKVFMCTGYVWDGICGTSTQKLDECVVLTPPLYHGVSSIGPDFGTALVLFRDGFCLDHSTSYTLFGPGSVDLRKEGWDKRIGSFRIRKIQGDYCVGRGWDREALPGVTCERCCSGCDVAGVDCKQV